MGFLSTFYILFFQQNLVRLLDDEDELVRADACDSLSFSNSEKVLNLLMEVLESEKVDLVRGYAVSSIAHILANMKNTDKKYLNYFLDKLSSEQEIFVQLNIYMALYLLGEKEFLYKLLEELDNTNFKVRSLVVNLLKEVVCHNNKNIIKAHLKDLLEREETVLVKSYIENTVKYIDETIE